MKKEDFSLVLGDIRDDYIVQAHEPARPRRSAVPAWRRWCAAACLCLAALGTVLYAARTAPSGDEAENHQIVPGYNQVENGDRYMPPRAGEYFCFVEVNAAREQYAGRDVKFLLTMDVFQNEKQVAIGDLGGEFKRLGALGYDLRIVNREEQEGDEIIVWPEVVGLFTEEQLQGFPADPAYGYMFSFYVDTNGNLIRSDDPAVITGADIPE